MRPRVLLALVALAAGLVPVVPAAAQTPDVVYVDRSREGPDPGDGLSWATAFRGLQDALPGPGGANLEIWVAAGVYTPGPPSQPDISFQIPDGVAVYGGFAGGETSLDQRDWQTNVTVLSGDIDDNDLVGGPEGEDPHGVLTTPYGIVGDNSHRVVELRGTAVLDGVTVTGADGTGDGGGVAVLDGSATVRHVRLSGNRAVNGGGLAVNSVASADLVDVVVTGNQAVMAGGGMFLAGSARADRLRVQGNRSGRGGGGLTTTSPMPLLISNSLFAGNRADGVDVLSSGGGIQVDHDAELRVHNVTFTGNSAYIGASIMGGLRSRLYAHNSIFWDNDVRAGPPFTGVYVLGYVTVPETDVEVHRSIIPSCEPDDIWDMCSSGGNRVQDPRFVAPQPAWSAPFLGGDFRLRSTSPALDLGDANEVVGALDLAGLPRILGAGVDAGAYEQESVPAPPPPPPPPPSEEPEPPTEEPEPGPVQLSGGDAVDRAIAWSQHTTPSSTRQHRRGGVVLLGRDDVYADSLASGGAQGLWQAPLLLTTPHTLDPRTATELARLAPDTVVLLGGPDALADQVADDLGELGYTVERIAGPTRIETAAAIARTIAPTTHQVVIARAHPTDGGEATQGFADTLAGGALAADLQVPLLLTTSNQLSAATAAYLNEAGVTEAVLLGGDAAVGPQVVEALEALGITVTRLDGTNRFATAIAVAGHRGAPTGAHADAAVLTDGTDPLGWADAFPAALHASRTLTPIVLADGQRIPAETAAWLPGTPQLICGTNLTPTTCTTAHTLTEPAVTPGP